ncbi:MAG TPA: PsbP-related protein [Flavobacteriales bacterium]|nr:PsbP-related protein [Flavobacteriales bacterium]
MQKTFTFFALLSIIFAFTLADKWKTLTETDFSIQYPTSWELTQGGQMGTSFIIMAKAENDKDKFNENINLIIQDLKGTGLSLDEYTKLSLKQINDMAINAKLIENKRLKRNPECQKLIYTATQNKMPLEFEQYYWVIKNKAYVLTFSAEEKKFKKYHITAEQIMDSFKLNVK